MAIGSLRSKDLKALREHGHASSWEVATYGDLDSPSTVTVECTKCGEVLVELVNIDLEEDDAPTV